jgi:FAD/FMN-containing dehydrogenase
MQFTPHATFLVRISCCWNSLDYWCQQLTPLLTHSPRSLFNSSFFIKMLSQDLIFSLLLLLTILVALPITTATATTTTPGIFFIDWDGLQTCSPLSYSTPYTEQHIIDIIYHTKLRNETLKVIGTGHSFSGVQLTKGHMMSLDHYSEVVARTDLTATDGTATDGTATDGTATDGTTGHMYSLVEVQAGIRLRDFNNELEKMGLSMLNLGATAAQSVAGATATGTHGTGTKLGSISTQISAMRLIDSFGKVHVLSEHDENTDMFEAARVGIGALGAISTMTFKVVPLFKLRRRNIAYELPTLLKVFGSLHKLHDYIHMFTLLHLLTCLLAY